MTTDDGVELQCRHGLWSPPLTRSEKTASMPLARARSQQSRT
jgi:hypothetical protein